MHEARVHPGKPTVMHEARVHRVKPAAMQGRCVISHHAIFALITRQMSCNTS
jgi:hypothetical protein